jgi:hypothetical protein
MPKALELTLILVLLALAIGLVPLLFQLRKTALGLDLFLHSAKHDLSQIAEDVRASRLRMDNLAGTLQLTLSEISLFTKSVGELGIRVKELHTEYRTNLEATARIAGSVVGGLSAVLAFFKSKPTPQAPE